MCPIALLVLPVLAPAARTDLEWSLVDVAAGKVYSVTDAASKLTAGGTLDARPDGAGIHLQVRYEPGDAATALHVSLADLTGNDRGLVLRLNVPLDPAAKWRWWQDPEAAQPLGDKPLANTAGLRGLPGLPFFTEAERPDYGSYSVYPLGAVDDGQRWQALARPFSELVLARFGAVGGDQPRLTAEVDLALSEYTRPPRQGEVTLWYLAGPTSGRGMREALAGYYRAKPDDWEVRAPIFGGWMPFTDLAKLPNVDEFGFAYQEGAPNAAFDDALGANSFVYFHCAGEFANVPGYQRGGEPQPPYDDVVAAFNLVAQQHSGVEHAWDLCGVRSADGRIDYRPEKTYGDFFCQACVDPDLPYGRAMAERLLARVKDKPFPEGIDGVYYDGIAVGLDYAPEHLQHADHLLLWDGKLGRPVNYNLFSSAEWAAWIHEQLDGTGKLTMLNDSSLSSFPFVGSSIDVPGGEMSIYLSRAQARQIRALCYHRPFCTLVKADFNQVSQELLESYLRRCVTYGILFGFFDITPSGDHPGSSYWLHPEWFDRDRPLFRRYMPIAAELAEAGWEPDPGATAEGATVERFGPRDGGLSYLTVATDPRDEPETPQDVQVRFDQAPPGLAVELLTGRIEPATPTLSMPLTGDDLAVWSLGPAEAQATACLARARDILDRRAAYLAACRLGAASLSPWAPYQQLGAKLATPGRDGGHALLIERAAADNDGAGATQTIVVNHDRPRKLVVSAWSRTEDLSGETDRDCAVYVDCYYTDGTAIYGQTIPIATGTHDWQQGTMTIEPAKPIRNINVYLLCRARHTGKVWLDDVQVALADQPERNLLRRGDFETDTSAALASDDAAAQTIDNAATTLAKLLEASPAKLDAAACEAQLADMEQAAKQANWGPDTERTLRDVEDLRWHLALAQACLAAERQTGQRPTRLTALTMLRAASVATGPKQYRANTGHVPPGTMITVDSNYSGYAPYPLTDGKVNPKDVHWTKVAWASDDGDGAHWIELRFPQPAAVSGLRVWWAMDDGRLHVARQVTFERLDGDQWVPIEADPTTDAVKGLTTFKLPGDAVAALRLVQPGGMGSSERPGLMWVSELEVVTGER